MPASSLAVAPFAYLPKTATTLSAPSSHTRWYSGYFVSPLSGLTVTLAVDLVTSAAAKEQPAAAGRKWYQKFEGLMSAPSPSLHIGAYLPSNVACPAVSTRFGSVS